jgi:beta-galactosidase
MMKRASFNDGWCFRPKVSAFLELGGALPSWLPVRLPHDAMIGSPRSPSEGPGNAYFPGGTWEYQQDFAVPADAHGKRMFVEFEGVYRDAAVWVNGSFAGHHPYGYTGFTLAIDHLVRHGDDNEIRVEVTTQEDARWYSGAGIYRNVKLVVGELVHLALDSLWVTTPELDDEIAVVQVSAVLENDGAVTMPTSVETEIVDDVGVVVASEVSPLTSFPRQSATVRQRLVVRGPKRWSVETPSLYACRVVVRDRDGVELDRDETTFGIRSLQLDAARGLRINGEVVNLRGACVHHDNGVIGAATVERADERRVEILKASGFNAIRSAHNPASKALLDACDRLGMLVMDEAFDMWNHPKMRNDYARVSPEWWETDIDAMVRKDRNHPSVILYSIGNEIPDTGDPLGADLGRRLTERVRALDDTRYVTNGVNPLIAVGIQTILEMASPPATAADSDDDPDAGEENAGINTVMQRLRDALPALLQSEEVAEKLDEPYSYLDVAGYNYSDARYDLDGTRMPNRVIVGTETHNTNIAQNWPKVLALPHVIGDFTWTGWDYLGEVGLGRVEYGADSGLLMGDYPWLAAWCADIDLTGGRRALSYLREIVFGLRAEPYVSVRDPARHGLTSSHQGLAGEPWLEGLASWSWPGSEGRPVTVDVLSDADEVELLVNGTSLGRQPVGEASHFRTAFETIFEPGEVVAVTYHDGTEVARTELHSGTGLAGLDVRADRTEIRADDTDLGYIDITLVDDAGRLHHTDDRAVTVEVDGPGMLQGLGSANPCTDEMFGEPTHDTFHGRALAVVRPTAPGTITVTVTSDGLPSRKVTIEAREHPIST